MKGAGGNQGIDIRKINKLAQAGEFPAQAVALLHLVHAREKAGAHGSFDTGIHGTEPHGHLPAKGETAAADPLRVNPGQGFQVIHAPYEVPEPLAHQGAVLFIDLVLADHRGDGYEFLFRQFGCESFINVRLVHAVGFPPMSVDTDHGRVFFPLTLRGSQNNLHPPALS